MTTSLPSLLHHSGDPIVDIGFTQSAYTVSENQGLIWLYVEPTSPKTVLTRDIEVMFSVEPRTADSELSNDCSIL